MYNFQKYLTYCLIDNLDFVEQKIKQEKLSSSLLDSRLSYCNASASQLQFGQ